MKYNKISNTDLNISVITLGTWVFGGHLWNGRKEEDCIAAVHASLDAGINMIDTAPIYGNGESERIVGKAIQGRRDQVILATKCGLSSEGKDIIHDLTNGAIYKEIEDSLRRLQTDYIDLYQLHWPDLDVPIELTMECLGKLKAQGKIRHIGFSNHTPELFDRALEIGPVVTSQDQYSLLDRTIEENLLPYLKEKHVGLLAYGPLAGGILTGKYKEPPFFKKADARKFFYKYYEGDAFKRVQQALAEVRAMGKPLNEVALNWVRQQKGVASVLVGARNAEQAKQNACAADWDLTAEELEKVGNMFRECVHG